MRLNDSAVLSRVGPHPDRFLRRSEGGQHEEEEDQLAHVKWIGKFTATLRCAQLKARDSIGLACCSPGPRVELGKARSERTCCPDVRHSRCLSRVNLPLSQASQDRWCTRTRDCADLRHIRYRAKNW